ncbi:MAG: thermonuclease family protein [Roseibium sp.]|uniref:thermonuclease family protein n=1 Tax=Roseibium sp. TaxID=1936156 RepID=UPI0026237E9B|nr:thermonuclease family protein [Roseibium sp.]MCV0426219.1 thermonuclease family protein [Roseibium sp.]
MIRVAIAALVFASIREPRAQEWQSSVSRVIDGDTFQLSRPIVKIRLCGVDTPERGKPGHNEGALFLQVAVAGKQVQCRTVGEGTPCEGRSRKKTYDRFVAQCLVDGNDIAMELVKAGHACVWPKYSGLHYVKLGKCVR